MISNTILWSVLLSNMYMGMWTIYPFYIIKPIYFVHVCWILKFPNWKLPSGNSKTHKKKVNHFLRLKFTKWFPLISLMYLSPFWFTPCHKSTKFIYFIFYTHTPAYKLVYYYVDIPRTAIICMYDFICLCYYLWMFYVWMDKMFHL